MSEHPLELWAGVKGKYFRGLTLKELEAQAKINCTEQWVTDLILSGYVYSFQNCESTTPMQKDFYKVFEQLSINKP